MKVGDWVKVKRTLGHEGATGLIVAKGHGGEEPGEGWYKSSWIYFDVLVDETQKTIRCLEEDLEVISESG
tara:strand:+ start:1791 stop:2000 length:210 start_codon:yes stop_codon:yes gene_type:complete